jgi:hypothetical protein
MTITADLVREKFNYSPQTGEFTWRVHRNSAKIGTIAGRVHKHSPPYRKVWFDGRDYYVHRLIWLHCYGSWPSETVDHLNGDSLDNRIENLREATPHQNSLNRGIYSSNSTGLKGVSPWRGNTYRAHIRLHGKQKYLGTFDTPEAAHAAYWAAAQEMHGSFARAG